MELYDGLQRTIPQQAARMIFVTESAFTPRARDFLDRVPNPRVEKPFDGHNLLALVRGLVG